MGHVTNKWWGDDKMEGVNFRHFYFIYMTSMTNDKVTWSSNCYYNYFKKLKIIWYEHRQLYPPPTYIPTYFPTHQPTYLPPIYSPAHPSTLPPTYLFIYLPTHTWPTHLPTFLPIKPPIYYLPIHPPPIYLPSFYFLFLTTYFLPNILQLSITYLIIL